MNIQDEISDGYRTTYVFETILKIVNCTNLKFFEMYPWIKQGNSKPSIHPKRLTPIFEYIFHFVKDKSNFKYYTDRIRVPYADKKYQTNPIGKIPNGVMYFPKPKLSDHPARFDPELPGYFIKWLTDFNDYVLDPFMGYASTGVACSYLNRNYIGFELNKDYIEKAQEIITTANIGETPEAKFVNIAIYRQLSRYSQETIEKYMNDPNWNHQTISISLLMDKINRVMKSENYTPPPPDPIDDYILDNADKVHREAMWQAQEKGIDIESDKYDELVKDIADLMMEYERMDAEELAELED